MLDLPFELGKLLPVGCTAGTFRRHIPIIGHLWRTELFQQAQTVPLPVHGGEAPHDEVAKNQEEPGVSLRVWRDAVE